MPFDMQPSQLAMNFNGTRSTLQGTVNTRQGQIALSGATPTGRRSITGGRKLRRKAAGCGSRCRRWCVSDVSPDVVFTATPSLFNLDGKVDVPWARIVVNEVPESAVGVSSDEVMLDKNLKPIKQQSASIPDQQQPDHSRRQQRSSGSLRPESASDR